MADLSTITLPSGTTYNIKDATARTDISSLVDRVIDLEDLVQDLSKYTEYLGVTTANLTDGDTTNPISINGELVTATSGDIVTVQDTQKEFIWNGSAWQQFGDLSGLGALAYKNSASGSFTPAGTIGQPTFQGTSTTSTGKFTPAGSVTVSTNGTTNKTATVSAASGTPTFTPGGTVSQPTFTGSKLTSTGAFTPEGTIDFTETDMYLGVAAVSGTPKTYTPAGTVSAPTISVKTAGTTTTVKNPTSTTCAKTVIAAAPGATAPANAVTYYDVSGENLKLYQLGYTTGASITTSNVTVKTGDAAYEASQPAFTGTGVRLQTSEFSVPMGATFTGTEGNVSVEGTPAGTVSQPTFTGTGARLVTGNIAVPNTYTASFTGTEGNVSVTGTPSGTVSQPSFTGTAGTVTVS